MDAKDGGTFLENSSTPIRGRHSSKTTESTTEADNGTEAKRNRQKEMSH